MSLRIQLVDGSFFDPNKQMETMTMPEPKVFMNVLPTAADAPIIDADCPELKTRTRLQIATELDQAERELAANLSIIELDRAKIRRLMAELKNFGRKPRAPKGTP